MGEEKVLAFRIDVKGVSTEDQELAKLDVQLRNLIKEKNELLKISQKEGILSNENKDKLAAYNQEIRRMSEEKRNLTKIVGTSVDSLERMRAKLIQMKAAANSGGAELREKMSPAINKLTDDIKKAEEAQGTHTRGVDNYKEAIIGAVKQLGAWALATVSVQLVIKTFTAVMNSTGKTADEFEAQLAGVKGGFDAIKRAVATMDFTDFTRKVKEAINEAIRYTKELDTIDDKTRALQVSEAKLENQIRELAIEQKLATNTLEEQNAAGDKAVELSKDLAGVRITIAQKAFDNELRNITSIAFGVSNVNELTEKQILLYFNRDQQFMKGIAIGAEYNQLLKDQADAEKEIARQSALGVAPLESVLRKKDEATAAVNRATEAQKEWGRIEASVTIPLDEKYNLLRDKMIDVEKAHGSVLEETMRIVVKDAAIQEKANEEMRKKNVMLKEGSAEWDKAVDAIAQNIVETQAWLDLPIEERLSALNEANRIISEVTAPERTVEGYAKVTPEEVAAGEGEQKSQEEITAEKEAVWQSEADAGLEIFQKNQEARTEIERVEVEKQKKIEEQKKEFIKQLELAGIQGAQMAFDAILSSRRNNLQATMTAELAKEGLTEAQKVAIRKKYAKEQQKIDIIQAIINGVLSIAKTFATYGFTPIGIIMAALSAVTTAVQIAVIKSQKFAASGKIAGGMQIISDPQRDNTLVLAKQGEVILNERHQAMLGGARTFRRMGVPGFAESGVVGSAIPEIGTATTYEDIVAALSASINEIRVVQYLSDLQGAENELSVTQHRSVI
jgi:hypothetical protein